MTNLADAAGLDAQATRNAYNAAFYELGLRWFWDSGCGLPDGGDERACMRAYLTRHQAHLLTAYDADFLIEAILDAKARCTAQMAAAGTAAIDWRELQQHQIGV